MEIKVYNQSGKETGTAELPDSVFGVKWNPELVYQVVTSQSSNMRRNLAHAKDRAQVRGGGRKPWRQKGTGRARHGSIRSPLWKGGGVTHGPLKEKNYKKKVNKKMAQAALCVVLSAKAREGELIVVENLNFLQPKTRFAAIVFKNLAENFPALAKGNGALVALPQKAKDVKRALGNLPYVGLDEARNLNAREVLQYKYLLMPKDALSELTKIRTAKS